MKQQRNKIRIIGGEYRRRLLSIPDAPGLRPTPDRVRETVFNWLGQVLYGKRCLDLFAGSGAMGFEAASRGAARVVMVEKGLAVVDALQANKKMLTAAKVDVVYMDALHYLRQGREVFDIVFVDPPYDDGLLPKVLPLLVSVLASKAVVYVENKVWTAFEGWDTLRQAKAGEVCYGLIARHMAD